MNIRDRFPIFKSKTYLNSCSQGALSVDVKKAYVDFMNDWERNGSPWEYWVERNEAARHAFAGLVNARPDEVTVTTSVSAAVSALATAIDFSGERNRVVVGDFNFPSTAQIWHAQAPRGAKVVHVPAAGNVIPRERWAEAIDERTKLVSLSHVCFRNGTKQDAAAIIELAHEKGALVLLDAYQSLGTMPIDVRALKVDFLTGGVLKYLLASAGLAYLYVRPDHLAHLDPTHTGWFAQANIFAMDIYAHTPSPTARRFESGTPPVPNIYAALAGIKLIQAIGLENIKAHVRTLTDFFKAEAMKRGFNLASPIHPDQHGALVSVRSHKVDLLVKWLEEDGIIVSSRDDNLRVSPHIYNNLGDMERLLAGLDKHKALLV